MLRQWPPFRGTSKLVAVETGVTPTQYGLPVPCAAPLLADGGRGCAGVSSSSQVDVPVTTSASAPMGSTPFVVVISIPKTTAVCTRTEPTQPLRAEAPVFVPSSLKVGDGDGDGDGAAMTLLTEMWLERL